MMTNFPEITFGTKPTSKPEWMWSNIQSPRPYLVGGSDRRIHGIFSGFAADLRKPLEELLDNLSCLGQLSPSMRSWLLYILTTASWSSIPIMMLPKWSEFQQILSTPSKLELNLLRYILVKGISDLTGSTYITTSVSSNHILKPSPYCVFRANLYSNSIPSIVQFCRMTAILLDLALVSYVGSHGLRFDLDFIKTDTTSILVNSGEESR